tara:strand:- start:480 stop:740 length:261 start_codon:yes stop_codon:yes gene_type:complete
MRLLNMKRFVIINKDQVSSVNFSEVMETSTSTLRYNLDGTKTFVKFNGDTPSFVTNETIYNETEFYEFTSDYNNGWCVDPELEEQV